MLGQQELHKLSGCSRKPIDSQEAESSLHMLGRGSSRGGQLLENFKSAVFLRELARFVEFLSLAKSLTAATLESYLGQGGARAAAQAVLR